ncbi:MAG TPA: CPBP family intramembrane glutamic endopeptidase, partial [Nitrospira sp.]
MRAPEPSHSGIAARAERGTALALLPIAATLDYYTLPDWLQEQTLVQFAPQIIAYLAFGLWAAHNSERVFRLGLEKQKIGSGVRLGLFTGLALGCLNSFMILRMFPDWGYDITFLRDTPHARMPMFAMVPWVIAVIAIFVELNFRGFLLGRLLAMIETLPGQRRQTCIAVPAVIVSAIVFAFDPFMTRTFRHLHWIAVWDGALWGALYVMTRNLYIPIVAHAVEVILVYSVVRSVL